MDCRDIAWMYMEIGRKVGRETGDSFCSAMSKVVYLLSGSPPVYLLAPLL